MFWQQQQRNGVPARPHHLSALRGVRGAHLRSIRYELTVATVDVRWFLHSCNYPVFPFAFTLTRPSGNLFFDISGTVMKAPALSFMVQSFDTS